MSGDDELGLPSDVDHHSDSDLELPDTVRPADLQCLMDAQEPTLAQSSSSSAVCDQSLAIAEVVFSHTWAGDDLPGDVVDICEYDLQSDIPRFASKKRVGELPLARRGEKMVRRKTKISNAAVVMNRACCSQKCISNFTSAEIIDWRQRFRSMIKSDQDRLLWNMVQQASSRIHHQNWELLRRAVCRPAIFYMTGAQHRLKKFRTACLQGHLNHPADLRGLQKYRKLGPQSNDVNSYLECLYWSAETIMIVKDCKGADVTQPQTEVADDLVVVYDNTLKDLDAVSGTVDISVRDTVGNATGKLTEGKRYLQPGTWIDEYRVYRFDRIAKQLNPASWTTWWRTWDRLWKDKLTHRNEFFTAAKCSTCIKYKTIMKQLSMLESLQFWSAHYVRHLMSQHCDRQTYYHERLHSRNTALGMLIGFESTCVIIIDAMGMASFKVPRHLPGSKEMGDLARPQLHVVGVIAHGFHKGGYLFDPTIAKDCNVFIEIILCTIARINKHCRDKRLSFPSRCLIVADNAGDNKNTWPFTMSAMFAASSVCRVVAHLSSRTGHSREDIDAMFGDWANVLVKQPTLETR